MHRHCDSFVGNTRTHSQTFVKPFGIAVCIGFGYGNKQHNDRMEPQRHNRILLQMPSFICSYRI